MPKFLVPITRDVTETTHVIVDADTVGEAVGVAVWKAMSAPERFSWTRDDCMGGPPYFAPEDNYEGVQELIDA